MAPKAFQTMVPQEHPPYTKDRHTAGPHCPLTAYLPQNGGARDRPALKRARKEKEGNSLVQSDTLLLKEKLGSMSYKVQEIINLPPK